mmetsp:Transcript_33348/g.87795  ORF Transcript_33348/g.87795 Transcript_33348/m.87795 type:complete len:235 (-) Transcript_33348:302-1006(-)
MHTHHVHMLNVAHMPRFSILRICRAPVLRPLPAQAHLSTSCSGAEDDGCWNEGSEGAVRGSSGAARLCSISSSWRSSRLSRPSALLGGTSAPISCPYRGVSLMASAARLGSMGEVETADTPISAAGADCTMGCGVRREGVAGRDGSACFCCSCCSCCWRLGCCRYQKTEHRRPEDIEPPSIARGFAAHTRRMFCPSCTSTRCTEPITPRTPPTRNGLTTSFLPRAFSREQTPPL